VFFLRVPKKELAFKDEKYELEKGRPDQDVPKTSARVTRVHGAN
jgi:hypothetical protein